MLLTRPVVSKPVFVHVQVMDTLFCLRSLQQLYFVKIANEQDLCRAEYIRPPIQFILKCTFYIYLIQIKSFTATITKTREQDTIYTLLLLFELIVCNFKTLNIDWFCLMTDWSLVYHTTYQVSLFKISLSEAF